MTKIVISMVDIAAIIHGLVMESVMIRTILHHVVILMVAIVVQTRIPWVMEFVTLTISMLDAFMIKAIVVMKL